MYLNSLEKDDKSSYLVRVCVKPGHPKHLYHIINNQQTLDFFVRHDRNVEKKDFPDAYKMIMERLKNFDDAK